jgi:hypothetical protein
MGPHLWPTWFLAQKQARRRDDGIPQECIDGAAHEAEAWHVLQGFDGEDLVVLFLI